ncbi:hypothetical protein EDB85DRAFT_1953508 [Lactarius pseudohatsudake]|nr:hypothetical protein EDB85DRAFT_1953508 [Lactarius pseudohatsudake]
MRTTAFFVCLCLQVATVTGIAMDHWHTYLHTYDYYPLVGSVSSPWAESLARHSLRASPRYGRPFCVFDSGLCILCMCASPVYHVSARRMCVC